MNTTQKRIAVLANCFFAMFFMPVCSYASEGPMPKPEKFIQDWSLKPSVPTGWVKVEEQEAYVTSTKNPDVFILMKDQVNLMLVWFKREGGYWNMIVMDSMPIKNILDYGVNIEYVGLYIDGKKIFLGVDGSEAITIYEWDPKRRLFVGKIP